MMRKRSRRWPSAIAGSRAGFEGRAQFRTWLYRIATNACLNALERAPRRVLPQDVAPAVTASTDASQARSEPAWAPEIPWLQPYPDSRLEPVAPPETQPESAAVARESIEDVGGGQRVRSRLRPPERAHQARVGDD
jgi:DNA-directed RNA polymerase specialized sigma24 family protein